MLMPKRFVKNLIYEDLTYKIQGCFYTVYNTLGFGHKEAVYKKALAREFTKNKIQFEEEKAISISYDGEVIGSYRPDFVVEDKIIIEVKAINPLPKRLLTQLINYLKGSGYRLGFIVNFGTPRLGIYRRVWTRKSA